MNDELDEVTDEDANGRNQQEEPGKDKDMDRFRRLLAVPIKLEDYSKKPVEVAEDDIVEFMKVKYIISDYSILYYYDDRDTKYNMATRSFVEGILEKLKKEELGLNKESELPSKDGEEIIGILNKVFDDKKGYLLKVGTPSGDMEDYYVVNPYALPKQSVLEKRLKKDAMPESQKLQDPFPGIES